MTALWGYLNNDRAYHTLVHPGEMLRDLNDYYPEFSDDMVLKYSIAYHDCRYDAGSPHNEFASATYACNELFDVLPVGDRADMWDLIMVTRNHYPIQDYRSNIIIDLDLRGLGSDPETYQRNSWNVRYEFSQFDDETWRAGRMKFLTDFLGRDTIYHTDIGYELWEQQAQYNLHAEYTYLKELQ